MSDDLNGQMRIAALDGRTAAMNGLLDHQGAEVHSTNSAGGTALHLAARLGRDGCVDSLVKRGANVNAQNIGKRTPLMFAAGNGHPSIVQKLLAAGADPTLKDEEGKTALDLAKRYNYTECIRWLENAAAARAQVTHHDELVVAARALLEALPEDAVVGELVDALEERLESDKWTFYKLGASINAERRRGDFQTSHAKLTKVHETNSCSKKFEAEKHAHKALCEHGGPFATDQWVKKFVESSLVDPAAMEIFAIDASDPVEHERILELFKAEMNKAIETVRAAAS